MRNLIIGAAALLAVAAPAVASAETGGHLQLTYVGLDDDGASSKDNAIALSGTVITDLGHPGWRLQFNGVTTDLDTYNTSYAYSQGEVHATYDMGQFQVGVFTGMMNLNGWGYYEYGVEGAINFERGQIAVSLAGATSPNSSFDDATSIAATGTFNLTENFSIGATMSSTDFDNYGPGEDVESWGVNVSYAIPNTHLAIGAGYRSTEYGSNDVEFIGVSLSWGFGDGAQGRRMPGAMAFIPDAMAIE